MQRRIHISHITTFLLGIMCILMQYRYRVNLGYIVGFVLLVFCIIKKQHFYISSDFLFIIVAITLQTWLCVIFGILHYNLAISDTVNFVLLAMLIALCYNYDDSAKVIKIYKKICLICAWVVIGQTALTMIFGVQSGALRILPQSVQTDAYWQTTSYRPSAFFTEAQTYCSFLLPSLILMVKDREYIKSGLVTFSFLLTGSSMGVMVALAPWVALLLSSSIKIYQKVLLTIVTCLLGALFLTSAAFEISVDKLITIFKDFGNYSSLNMIQSTSYSNYMRIIKGWTTFSEMSWSNKLTGLGFYNFSNYVQKHDLYFTWSRIWNNTSASAAYYSSASGVFIDFGLIVGSLYYIYIVRLFTGGNSSQKMILFCMLLQSLFTQIHFNSLCVFYLMTYYLLQEHKCIPKHTTDLVM